MRKSLFLSIAGLLFFSYNNLYAQNSMTGDGFGGRGWYVPHNYQVGAYSAYTVCGDSNQLYGWGRNTYSELGNGTTISTIVPAVVTGITDVKFYSTGYLSAVIKNDNTAWVWGTTDAIAPSGFSNIPTQILSNVKFADAAVTHIVFVKTDGTVWAAGRNDNGELGNGATSTIPINNPVQMTGITNAVRAVAVGYTNGYQFAATVILLGDGTVKITGGGGWFQINNSTTPETVTGLTNIIDITGNTQAAYALDSNGKVYSFGRDFVIPLSNGGTYVYPVLGHSNVTGNFTPPTQINFPPSAAPIVALSANVDGISAIALDSAHNAYAWGYNKFGQ